jgi:hypothetical protein
VLSFQGLEPEKVGGKEEPERPVMIARTRYQIISYERATTPESRNGERDAQPHGAAA